METSTEIVVGLGNDSPLDTNAKFDPSDYLPRRTSRSSAQIASEAIKTSVKEDNTDPSKKTGDSNKGKELKKESSHAGKIKSGVKAKAKQRPISPYDCYISLVRCDEDPALKKLSACVENRDKKKGSRYKVVYGPMGLADKDRLLKAQANGAMVSKKKENAAGCVGQERDSFPRQKKSRYLSRDASVCRQQSTSFKPSSLNVVVVHPKPGSKIVNTFKGRESRSARLHDLISDPNTVISSDVSRIMTTGGNAELQCSKCSKTYLVPRDLINHKRVAHKTSQHMCITCAEEFPTAEGLGDHKCKAKFRCDICGTLCKSASSLVQHRKLAHPKTLGDYMCYVCCFNASSQEELSSHICGGRPKIKYSAQASSAVMVYPTWDSKSKASTSTPRPNIYVNIPGPSLPAVDASSSTSGPSSSSNPAQFLCEVCLNMYPTSAALASHKCEGAVVLDPAAGSDRSLPTGSPLPRVVPPLPTVPQPVMPVSMEVMPEVEQLAKFYSSVVFSE